MPLESVVITGVGPVSAIGCGREPFWESLLAGRHGFGPITLCDSTHSPSKIAAEVRDFRLEDYVQDGHLMARHTPRPVQFALAAGVLALHDSELDLDACDPDRFGTYVGTSIGNLGDALSLAERFERTGSVPPHAAFHAFNHSAACVVSSFFNIRGPMHTTTSGCNSGLDALGQSMRMLQAGAVDAMLVIGTDCEVVPEVLAALNASNSLATKYNKKPGIASRPFDKKRDGNVIGEGAAGLVLETEAHAKARNARIYARVVGYQICSAGQNRQYSHDNPDVDLRPCTRALRGAIREAGWQPSEVEMISANGSSSVNYDRIEATALREVFGDDLERIPLHSTKSMLGQHGAGSSALQVAAACLSIRRGTVPPTINCDKLDPQCGKLNVSKEARERFPRRAIVHAIGLGGFYYSVGAFESIERPDAMVSGAMQVSWSAEAHPRFQPSDKFREPLKPWRPRAD
ncbi:MAG: beta-ketoacyl-[acyl-carrier-protein] synthase family protein [Planctomycetes bacterium]|nr:beta-ketoacyl-[acyl-carrier-protein] synthase family protein [Planctomycetota bacterium]